MFSFSVLYASALYIRRTFFRIHLFKINKLSCPVISVGNITLGGTGKTPTVIQIAELLLQNHIRPLVISRGYARQDESDTLVVSDGRSVLVDTKIGGDEPVLIGSKLIGVPVVVGRDRYGAAREAMRMFKPDTVILDDGFQHIQMRRSLDIVLIDAGNPFGTGKLFPAGILREPLASLKRAHAVLITKIDNAEDVAILKKNIREQTPARIFTSHQLPTDLIDYRSGDTKPLSSLRGSKILALSGIARPESFTALLRSLGADIVTECTYPDHFAFQKSDLATIFQKAADKNISMIVTTEKDAVRIKNLNVDGIWALRIEMTVVERNEWEMFLLKGLKNA